MEQIDGHCNLIFTFLVANQKEIRFNRLHENLNALNAKMSKPTLIQHLHHLQTRHFIIRKKEGKQNVTYQLNWKAFEPLNEQMKFKQLNAHIAEEEKDFKSRRLEYQMDFVIGILTMMEAIHLQFNVLSILEPKAEPYNTLGYVLIRRLYDNYRRWFLDTCRQSEGNSEKAHELIRKKVEKYQNMLFPARAKTTSENAGKSTQNVTLTAKRKSVARAAERLRHKNTAENC